MDKINHIKYLRDRKGQSLRSYLRCPFLLLMNNGSHRKTTDNFLFLNAIDDEKHDHP